VCRTARRVDDYVHQYLEGRRRLEEGAGWTKGRRLDEGGRLEEGAGWRNALAGGMRRLERRSTPGGNLGSAQIQLARDASV
jgi:hypothetical protein